MAMVDADGSCHFQRTRSPSRLAWSEGWRPTGAYSLHSSNEPDELSQWLCHDDSTINIISVIIIIIIFFLPRYSVPREKKKLCYAKKNVKLEWSLLLLLLHKTVVE